MRWFFARTNGTVYGGAIWDGSAEQIFEYGIADRIDRVNVCTDTDNFLYRGSPFDLDLFPHIFQKCWKAI